EHEEVDAHAAVAVRAIDERATRSELMEAAFRAPFGAHAASVDLVEHVDVRDLREFPRDRRVFEHQLVQSSWCDVPVPARHRWGFSVTVAPSSTICFFLRSSAAWAFFSSGVKPSLTSSCFSFSWLRWRFSARVK